MHLTEVRGTIQLRTLQTIDGLGPTASKPVVIAVPMEVVDAINVIRDAFREGKDGGSEGGNSGRDPR